VAFETVDLFEQPLDAAALKALLGRLGLRPRDLLRAKDPACSELGLGDPGVSDARLIAAMAAHPGLIQRPIVARGKRAVLARPVEKAAELLD
jgi:arsenate reductase